MKFQYFTFVIYLVYLLQENIFQFPSNQRDVPTSAKEREPTLTLSVDPGRTKRAWKLYIDIKNKDALIKTFLDIAQDANYNTLKVVLVAQIKCGLLRSVTCRKWM